MKIFCTLICLISLNILCHSAPQFNNYVSGEKCEVRGGSSQTNGIYTRDNIDPNIWKKLTDDRVIFNNDDNGWKIGTEGQSLYGTSYYFKSGRQNLPRLNGQTWTSSNNGNVTVKCISLSPPPCPLCSFGGVGGRRGCSGQLSLYQGETLLEQIEAVGVPKGRTQISSHETKNNFRIDSVEVTGDCCWEIESNDGDYEIVFEEDSQPDISAFLSQLSPEYYVYAKDYCF